MTMQFSQSLSPRLSRYSQDTVSADIIETCQETCQIASGLLATDQHRSSQPPMVRHSLPVPGLRYRSDTYRSVTAAQSTVRSTQSISSPVPHRELQVVAKTTEYDKTHQLHIQKRLQHRIAVAMAKGDQSLVKLLQRELWQAS